MIIICPSCEKKFEIDQNLIPDEGRLLQCGFCDEKWFFKNKVDINKDVIEEKSPIIDNENNTEVNQNIFEKENKSNDELKIKSEIKSPKIGIETKSKNRIPIKKKNNVNYLNIILVLIISFTAIIVLLDTFKIHLITVFPNLNIFLDNLYQSIKDVELFLVDLIK